MELYFATKAIIIIHKITSKHKQKIQRRAVAYNSECIIAYRTVGYNSRCIIRPVSVAGRGGAGGTIVPPALFQGGARGTKFN